MEVVRKKCLGCLILFRTIFCRQIWGNPIGDVLGNWSLHFSDGTLSTELIENIFLFIPFSMLVLWALEDKILKGRKDFSTMKLYHKIFKSRDDMSVYLENMDPLISYDEELLNRLTNARNTDVGNWGQTPLGRDKKKKNLMKVC